MRSHTLNKIKIFWICFLFFFSSLGISYATNDTIIAIVNDEVITLGDLREYLNIMSIQSAKEHENLNEIEGIDRLIETKLIINEANRKGMIIRDKIIDRRVNEIKSQYNSEQEFFSALAADGLTITDFRNKIVEQFKVEYLLDREVRSEIFVKPQEVTEYYQSNLNTLRTPEKVDLESILINFSGEFETIQQKITEVEEFLKKGEDFSKVAQKYSQSAAIGLVERGQLLPIIEEKVFALEEGQVSSPIEMKEGLYIFKVKKKYPEKIATLEEAKDKIQDILSHQKFRKRYKIWIEKLKKDAYIEIR